MEAARLAPANSRSAGLEANRGGGFKRSEERSLKRVSERRAGRFDLTLCDCAGVIRRHDASREICLNSCWWCAPGRGRGRPIRLAAILIALFSSAPVLMALSNIEHDREQNLQLLKERTWIDIPAVCADQRRPIVAIAKGMSG